MDDMSAELLQILASTSLDSQTAAARAAQIHATVLNKSKYLSDPNFGRIHTTDLALLFAEYDTAFFGGQIKRTLGEEPLSFGLSKRMTSSGGKTTKVTHRLTGKRRYEISVATTILFNCFSDLDHRPITACGIVCRDRLDALQRIMEHEITHLVEMLLWTKSSCAQDRFHSITRRFFGHLENKHNLITPRERAAVKFGIRPGSKVRFRFDGAQYTGVVNRVSKRATVLVEDPRGQRYTNGKHYAKFYVPVQSLEPVE
jgi:hypothetical protein